MNDDIDGVNDDSENTAGDAAPPVATKAPAATEAQPSDIKTIATGADSAKEPVLQPKAYWPEDWREKAAEHYAAGDKKAYDKELRRLQGITDPTGLYGMYREMEARMTSGGLIKMPGKDAKPEDVAAFRKALGVPETPEEYFKGIKLDNGAVIGELDKPIADDFAKAAHAAGATPEVVNGVLNWYFAKQEQEAAALDEADHNYRVSSEAALKEQYGPSFSRRANAIASLFASAPGGHDLKNPSGLYARLLGGRMADGRLIGNDPDMVRFLMDKAHEINPALTVVEDGNQSGLSIDAEIASIEKDMRENRSAYFKDEGKQNRYRELLTARDKIRARA